MPNTSEELEMAAMRNAVEVNDEGKPLFQLFFWKDDENKSVKVVEVEKIDFKELKKHIELGESVFITHKRKEKLNSNRIVSQEATEPWYFTHS